jgi:hypothetical protein
MYQYDSICAELPRKFINAVKNFTAVSSQSSTCADLNKGVLSEVPSEFEDKNRNGFMDPNKS